MDFEWNGRRASDFGLLVTGLPPIQTAGARTEEHPVPHRDGVLHIMDGTFDETIKPVEIYAPYEQTATVEEINTIKAWLRGAGDVIFSDEPNRVYRAVIISQIDFLQWVTGFDDRIATVVFQCAPHARHRHAPTVTVTASGTEISNGGTFYSLPLLIVTGTGDANITVGGVTFEIDGMTAQEPVYIDCEDMECYTLSGETRTPANSRMTGDFPTIPTGKSTVSWQGLEYADGENTRTGSVAQVMIETRWRDL